MFQVYDISLVNAMIYYVRLSPTFCEQYIFKIGIPTTCLYKCLVLSCQNVCDALTFLLGNICIRLGTKLYRQVVGISMGTNSCFVMRKTL